MNEYEFAMVLGFVLAVCVLLFLIGSAVTQRAWAFVDDSKVGNNNFAMVKICSLFGLKPNSEGSCWNYSNEKNDKKSDGDVPLLKVLLFSFLSPIFVLLAYKAYVITLFIFTLLILMFIARMAFRGKKLFNKHIKDKDAHRS